MKIHPSHSLFIHTQSQFKSYVKKMNQIQEEDVATAFAMAGHTTTRVR